MAQALREFVEKDVKEAVSTLVKWQLDQAQKHLKARQNVREDNLESEIMKHTEEIRHREEDEEDSEDVRKVLAVLLYLLKTSLYSLRVIACNIYLYHSHSVYSLLRLTVMNALTSSHC